MSGLGITAIEPAEELGPQRGAFGSVAINDGKIGTIPFYGLAFAIPAVGGAIAGAVVAPKRRVFGAAVGGLGAGIGGLTAVLILKAVSQ